MVSPNVTILMAVYNGAAHLSEQLDSFAAQTHTSWQVLASDDGSSDESPEILNDFAKNHPLTYLEGPCSGGTENFMSLVRCTQEYSPRDHWLAFSDQDDVWLPKKLERGIKALKNVPSDTPALYCSRTWITDEALGGRRLSPPRPKPLGFRNALVQNVVAGNTILLNAAGARLIEAAAQRTKEVVVHDWWVYQIMSGHGAILIHDDEPGLLYRQHDVNQIGANDTFNARMYRLGQLLRGRLRQWNDINLEAISASERYLNQENQEAFKEFREIRQQPFASRLYRLWKLRLYRQTLPGTLAMWVAAGLKKF